MNKVLLTGRLTRDPELRVLASGKNVTTFREFPHPRLRGSLRPASGAVVSGPHHQRRIRPLSIQP
jgi:Single-strand binding protein family